MRGAHKALHRAPREYQSGDKSPHSREAPFAECQNSLGGEDDQKHPEDVTDTIKRAGIYDDQSQRDHPDRRDEKQ